MAQNRENSDTEIVNRVMLYSLARFSTLGGNEVILTSSLLRIKIIVGDCVSIYCFTELSRDLSTVSRLGVGQFPRTIFDEIFDTSSRLLSSAVSFVMK